jgi:hypothetical protein
MMKYTTDPKEIYTLELNKLQRCFSELQRVGEEASELSKIGWRQVQYLQHVNFILQEAKQTSEMLLKIA